ncbi:MAG: CRISPR-associated endonuclease Cas2 [Marinifilaceae bacterium]
MVKKNIYIVAYDTPSNRRRVKFVKLLQSYGGIRKNKSVFECLISLDKYRNLQKEMDQLILPQKDVVLIYPLCQNCYSKAIMVGTKPTEPTVVNV